MSLDEGNSSCPQLHVAEWLRRLIGWSLCDSHGWSKPTFNILSSSCLRLLAFFLETCSNFSLCISRCQSYYVKLVNRISIRGSLLERTGARLNNLT